MADQGRSPSNRSTTAKGLKVRKTKTKNPLSNQVLRGVYKVNEGGYESCIAV
jgi:hypothetical protein